MTNEGEELDDDEINESDYSQGVIGRCQAEVS